MANYSDPIHDTLSATASDFSFPKVSMKPRARGAGFIRVTLSRTARAASVLVDQESSGFQQPILQRRGADPRERTAWTWIMDLGFKGPVSLEEFEASLKSSPPRVLRDPSNGLDQQVTLELEEAEYSHPPRQQPASGTRVRYRFTAVLTPL